jgi:hypothetical protein
VTGRARYRRARPASDPPRADGQFHQGSETSAAPGDFAPMRVRRAYVTTQLRPSHPGGRAKRLRRGLERARLGVRERGPQPATIRATALARQPRRRGGGDRGL